MKRIWITLILIAISSSWLSACDQKRRAPGQPASHPGVSLEGTSDRGGGGNLIDGRPIDDFAVDITALPEYNLLVSIDRSIERAMEANELAYLETLARKKTWYFVPVELDKLSKDTIGVAFESEQGAIQNDSAVFVSTIHYDKMSTEAKAKLLLHELIMGLFRVKFQDMKFYCDVMTKAEDRDGCTSGLVQEKDAELFKPAVQEDYLTTEQYDAIREVVRWLWEHHAKMTRTEWVTKLAEKGFDSRIFHAASGTDANERSVEISNERLVKLIKDTAGADRMPKHCGFSGGYPMKAEKTCSLEFDTTDGIKLKYVIDGQSMDLDLVAPTRANYRGFRSGLNWYALELINKEAAEVDHAYKVDLLIAQNGPDSFAIEAVTLKHVYKQMEGAESYRWIDFPTNTLTKALLFIYVKDSVEIYPEEIGL